MQLVARLLNAATIALMALMLVQSPAIAASASGTHAWSKTTLNLREGPGTAYAHNGEIAGDQAIMVLRCQRLWCLVDGDTGRGWTSKAYIDFGRPDFLLTKPPVIAANGPVCFYSGTNYSGQEFCLTSGRVIQDLALLGLDNGFASVRLNGTTSVSVCRDRFFQSYCERIVVSQPVLDEYLVQSLSSIRVH